MGTTDQFPQTDRNAGKRDVILFVDDEPPIRELMKTCLETEGFDVITAANGLEGLQR